MSRFASLEVARVAFGVALCAWMTGSSAQKIEEKQREVIEIICASKPFSKLKFGCEILRALFKMRDKEVSGKGLAGEVGFDGKQIESGNVRRHILNVRDALEEYAKAGLSDDEWRVLLPPQKGEGYQLKFISLKQSDGAVHAFWRNHLKPCRPIVIVRNEPLFFRDGEATAAVRILDEELAAGTEGRRRATSALSSALGQDLEAENVYESRLYAMSGEIGARDQIVDWFLMEIGQRVATLVSQRMVSADDLAESAPILLGNSRSNKILKEIMEWHPKELFPFRVDEQKIRTVQIVDASTPEEERLDVAFDTDLSGDDFMLCDNPRPDGVVFATVTRMPNRYTGENAVTILSASYTKALEQVAWLLTDEQALRDLFQKLGWSLDKDVPQYFQWLFSIKLGKHNADSRAVKPVLELFRAPAVKR